MDNPKNIEPPAGLSDERASEWVDALMDEREREAFGRELANDPELAAELQRFEQTVEILRRMPRPQAPDDFLEAVQSRIRRRSRGRWYGFQQASARFPFEAAFNIVLIGILFALYLSSNTWNEPARLVAPRFADPAVKRLDRALPANAAVSPPAVVDTTPAGSVLEVDVHTRTLDAVTRAIGDDPTLELLGQTARAPGQTLIRVRYKGRAPPAGGR